jgi:hypothetical protein
MPQCFPLLASAPIRTLAQTLLPLSSSPLVHFSAFGADRFVTPFRSRLADQTLQILQSTLTSGMLNSIKPIPDCSPLRTPSRKVLSETATGQDRALVATRDGAVIA